MHDYEVIEGRWGTKYAGQDGKKARRTYKRCVRDAIARNRPVTVSMFKDGVNVREFDVEAFQRGMELN